MPVKTMEEITTELKSMRFRKRLLGGVDETDVWKAVNTLNSEYQAIFDAETARHAALLAERDEEIRRLKTTDVRTALKTRPKGEHHA